jgi:hypothetical protein
MFFNVHFCRVPIRAHVQYTTGSGWSFCSLLNAQCMGCRGSTEYTESQAFFPVVQMANGVPHSLTPQRVLLPLPLGPRGDGREWGTNSDEEIDTLVPCVYYNLTTSLKGLIGLALIGDGWGGGGESPPNHAKNIADVVPLAHKRGLTE